VLVYVFSLHYRAFPLTQNYQPPEGYVPTMTTLLSDAPYGPDNEFLGLNRAIVPFVACGDLSGLDADQSYPLTAPDSEITSGAGSSSDGGYVYHPPVQAPIKPAYEAYLASRRSGLE
jgi:tRNA (cytidine32/guanosine34-2'-O)-methyltransferase